MPPENHFRAFMVWTNFCGLCALKVNDQHDLLFHCRNLHFINNEYCEKIWRLWKQCTSTLLISTFPCLNADISIQLNIIKILISCYIVVKISTVGYGDITPSTQLGQLVAICTIIAALTILPVQIGKISYLASRRYYVVLNSNWYEEGQIGFDFNCSKQPLFMPVYDPDCRHTCRILWDGFLFWISMLIM